MDKLSNKNFDQNLYIYIKTWETPIFQKNPLINL